MEKTRRTAVIVDDEPVTRMDLADMLEEAGFRVAGEAGDGFDAVELCGEKRPDVVLMDVKMPVFDGLTAAETILSRELAGCVVLLTAKKSSSFFLVSSIRFPPPESRNPPIRFRYIIHPSCDTHPVHRRRHPAYPESSGCWQYPSHPSVPRKSGESSSPLQPPS